jgi:hypothetical protein
MGEREDRALSRTEHPIHIKEKEDPLWQRKAEAEE